MIRKNEKMQRCLKRTSELIHLVHVEPFTKGLIKKKLLLLHKT